MSALRSLLPAIALGVAAIAGASAALGQAAPVATGATMACQLMGHDLVVINRGEAPLPAGTVLKWSVVAPRMAGQHKLEAELVPFVGRYLIDELGTNYVWDKPCSVEVVPASAAPVLPGASTRTQ